MTQFLDIIGFALLFYPLAWELNNDKHGDDGYVKIMGHQVKNKTKDVYIRGLLMVSISGLNWMVNGKCFGCSLILTIGIHVMFFDYLIAYILGHHDWFSYLGQKSVVDNLPAWRSQSARNRFLLRLVIIIFGITNYFGIIR